MQRFAQRHFAQVERLQDLVEAFARALALRRQCAREQQHGEGQEVLHRMIRYWPMVPISATTPSCAMRSMRNPMVLCPRSTTPCAMPVLTDVEGSEVDEDGVDTFRFLARARCSLVR